MTDTPRLSRKELRELGQLAARNPQEPALSETQELHLHRPSRKELREAEKANAQAEERIRASVVTVSEEPSEPAADAQDTDDAAQAHADHVSDAADTEVQDAAPSQPMLDAQTPEASVSDKAGETFGGASSPDEGQSSDDGDVQVDVPEDQQSAQEQTETETDAETEAEAAPEGADQEALSGDEDEESVEAGDSEMGDQDADGEQAADGEPDQAEAGAAAHHGESGYLERKSVFERFDDEPESADANRSLRERLIDRAQSEGFSASDEADKAAMSSAEDDVPSGSDDTDHAHGGNATGEPETADAERSFADSEDQSEPSADLRPEDDLNDGESDTQNISAVADPSSEAPGEEASEAAARPGDTPRSTGGEQSDPALAEAESHAQAPAQGGDTMGWLILAILVVIGGLIGYFVGNWMKATFLSQGLLGISGVSAAGFLGSLLM